MSVTRCRNELTECVNVECDVHAGNGQIEHLTIQIPLMSWIIEQATISVIESEPQIHWSVS